MNIDIEIYIKKIIDFFETNPNDLSTLIGEINKERFYLEIKNKILDNAQKTKDFEITRNQMIDIVVTLTGKTKKQVNTIPSSEFGPIYYN